MTEHQIKCIACEINEEICDLGENGKGGRSVRKLNLVGDNELGCNSCDDECNEEQTMARVSNQHMENMGANPRGADLHSTLISFELAPSPERSIKNEASKPETKNTVVVLAVTFHVESKRILTLDTKCRDCV